MNSAFGNVIKHWRGLRRFSQLALAHEADISSRHISFLETGRSRPSRECVMTLSRALSLPKSAVNEALHAAGFTPEYPQLDLEDIDLAPLIIAMETILEKHDPYPAIVIDGHWKIVGGNTSAQEMMHFLPFGGSSCLVDALLNDDLENSIFLNWNTIANWSLYRLRAESIRNGQQSHLSELASRLSVDSRLMGMQETCDPYLTLKVKIEGVELSLVMLLVEFSSAMDVTMSERRIELFFPEDEVTKLFFLHRAGNKP